MPHEMKCNPNLMFILYVLSFQMSADASLIIHSYLHMNKILLNQFKFTGYLKLDSHTQYLASQQNLTGLCSLGNQRSLQSHS